MKLNYKRTLLIGLAFMSISAFWQMFDNVVPLILTNKNTFNLGDTMTGAIMAFDNVLAIFLLPLFGSLSDRAKTKFGKRIPFIIFGTIPAAILLLTLNTANRQANLPLFIIIFIMLIVAMSIYRAPTVAMMPDFTPNNLRSKGNAVINLLGAVGGAYALVMIMIFTGDDPHQDYFLLFLSIAILMLVSATILFLTIKEKKVSREVKQEILAYEQRTGQKLIVNIADADAVYTKEDFKGKLFAGMDKDVKRSMKFLFASIFLWFTAYNAVTTAFSRYAIKVWRVEGGAYAQLLMIAMVAAIIAFIPIGNLATKIGRKITILTGIVTMTASYWMVAFLREPHPIMYVFFALVGIGWAMINVNSYPMVVEMSKGHNIGRFTG
ncbi:MAG: MFS transporter, partial [Lachnospiraceae bacterium]|nr:MFS transporter [Lachnospiraceae bacterium]